MIRHSGLLLALLLALILLWAPLPFGGVIPWAAALLAALAFAALALAAVAVESLPTLRPAALPAAALAGMALLGLLQAAPLPAGLVAALSPEHAALERQAASLSASTAAAISAPARLTLAVSSTRRAAVGWAAAAAAFLAGAVAGRRRELRRWLAGSVLAGALFQVLFGARDWLSRATTLWGMDLPSAVRLRGTFVNPNHLALYLEMALPAAFAWSWWAARHVRDEPRFERRISLAAPPMMLWLTLFAGLAFTGSRAGLLAAAAAVSAQGVLAAGERRRWWLAPLGAAVALAGIAAVAAIGWREGLGRLLATSAADVSLGARLREYGAALDLWRRFPATGTGLGTFRDAFPLVQPADLQGTWWHPHSDPLEVLVTAGLAGAALLAAGLWGLAARLAAVLRDGGRSEDRAAGLAALGVLVSLAVHEELDFGLSMPGNAVTLAVLLGAASAARVRERSAQLGHAGQDLAAVEALELEHVEPAPERRRHLQRRRARPDGELPHGRPVEP
ncbi:MAG TPA: O-antigen ligase family protein [Thermoanaerobaculia bacterium]|jgi:O-antigen ligase